MPEDLMGTILGEASGASGGERTLAESRGLRDAAQGTPGSEGTVSWERHPERVGITFNLSKQVSTELDKLRLELEEDVRPSRSEIAEAALRIAVEDVRERGRESELVKRLSGQPGPRTMPTKVDPLPCAASTKPASSSRPPTTRTGRS